MCVCVYYKIYTHYMTQMPEHIPWNEHCMFKMANEALVLLLWTGLCREVCHSLVPHGQLHHNVEVGDCEYEMEETVAINNPVSLVEDDLLTSPGHRWPRHCEKRKSYEVNSH